VSDASYVIDYDDYNLYATSAVNVRVKRIDSA
jgi:hypothetical protein